MGRLISPLRYAFPMADQKYSELQSKVLKYLRGSKSQGHIGQKLGVNTSNYSKWESGTNALKWDRFVDFCDICGVSLSFHLYRALGYNGDVKNYADLILFFSDKRGISELAQFLDCSRNTVSQWLNRSVAPNLGVVLKLIDHRGELLQFLASFVDLEQAGLASDAYISERKLRDLTVLNPLIPILIQYIDLKQGSYQVGEMAQKLDISQREEESMVAVLLKEKLIVHTDAGLRPARTFSFNTGGGTCDDFIKSLKIKRFWLEWSQKVIDEKIDIYSHEDLKEEHNKGRFAFKELCISDQAAEDISNEMAKFFYKVQEIVDRDQGPKAHIKILNFSLLHILDEYSTPNYHKISKETDFSFNTSHKL